MISRIGRERVLTVCLIAFGLHALPCEAQPGQKASPPNSLQPGITRTQGDLQNISRLIADNHREMNNILNNMAIDLSGVAAGPQSTRLANAIRALSDAWGAGTDSYDATKDSVLEHDPWIKLSDDLKIVMDLWGAVNPLVGVANVTTDIAVLSAQFSALHVQTEQLEMVQLRLQEALLNLQARDPATKARVQADVQRAMQQLSEQQRIYAELLKRNYKDRPNIIQLAVQNPPAKASAGAAAQIAGGVSIVDPEQSLWDLSKAPGINPDFIRALQCDRAATAACFSGNPAACDASYACRRYADGSYIPAFVLGGDQKPTSAAGSFGSNVGGTTPSPTSKNPAANGAAPPATDRGGADGRKGTATSPPATRGDTRSVNPSVGQVTLKWNGANVVGWKVVDASKKYVLRDTTAGAGRSQAEDLAPGSYFVVLDGKPEFQPMPVTVTAGQASTITPPVGSVTLKWNGANVVGWKVVDASKKYVLRDTTAGAGGSQAEDLAPGSYFVVLDGKPEFQPIPVTVSAGQASAVTPPVGSVTLKWNGASVVGWKVVDENKKYVLRDTVTGAGASHTEDLAPGSYFIVLDGKPEFQPMGITVVASKAVQLSVP